MTQIEQEHTGLATLDTSTETVEALLKDVTDGPWYFGKSYGAVVSDSHSGYDGDSDTLAYGGYMVCESIKDHNRPFIAASRELVPALLAERDALKAKLAKAVEVAEKSMKWLRLYGADVHREASTLAELKGESHE